MSHAFVREGDEQWLHDIPPTLNALINYLTSQNNGIRVYEKSVKTATDTQKQIHEMSNGLSYTVGADSKWEIVD